MLDVLFSQSLFNVIFNSFGIYNYKAEVTFVVLAVQVVFIIVIFAIVAFFKAGNVKKCDVKLLIVE